MRYVLLEPLRGLAALWVFCFHFQFSEVFQRQFPGVHSIFKAGDLGVPMFFVLSGFCITASARSVIRRQEAWSSFLYRRLRRIYPPFWLSILIVISIPFLIEFLSFLKTGTYAPPSRENLNYGYLNYGLTDWVLVGSLTQAFTYVLDAQSLQHKFTTINAVYWTLAIEVQFYLVATLAVGRRRFFYPALFGVTVLAIPTLYVSSLAISGIFLPFWPMFGIGVLLYWIFERGISPSRLLGANARIWSSMLLLVMACALVGLLLNETRINGLAFAAFFAVALFLAEGLDGLFSEKVLASQRKLVKAIARLTMMLGAMSYSLYLLHGRLQYLTMMPLRQFLPTNSIAYDIAVIALTCCACFLFYYACERPFMSSRQQAFDKVPSAPSTRLTATREPSVIS